MLPESSTSLTYEVWAPYTPLTESRPAMHIMARFMYFMEALDRRDNYESRGVYAVVRDTMTGNSYPIRDVAGLVVS